MYESQYRVIYTKEQEQIEKSYYISNINERLIFLRNIKAENHPTEQTTKSGSTSLKVKENYKLGFQSGTIPECYIRILIIENLLNAIFEEAKKIEDKQAKAFFLVSERYKYRKNLFDTDKENKAFEYEYNSYISDKILDKLNDTDTETTQTIKENSIIKNPIIWTKRKNIIGTLFGLLLKENLITGSKEDIATALSTMFPNLSKSTLLKQIGFQKNNEGVFYSCSDTETNAKEFLNWIANQPTTTKEDIKE